MKLRDIVKPADWCIIALLLGVIILGAMANSMHSIMLELPTSPPRPEAVFAHLRAVDRITDVAATLIGVALGVKLAFNVLPFIRKAMVGDEGQDS